MVTNENELPPPGFGDWRDAEALRRWSFARRTPQQRLDWLVAALTMKYEAAEVRAAQPGGRIKVGSALARIAEPFGGLDLDSVRDRSVDEPTFPE